MNARSWGTVIALLVVPLLACKALQQENDEPSSDETAGEEAAGEPVDDEEDNHPVQLKSEYSKGEKAELDGLTVWVDSWRECQKRSNRRWMGLLVYYEGTLPEGNADIHPANWKAYDAEGITYDRHGGVTFGDCKPILNGHHVAKGDKKMGWVNFDIPEGTQATTFKYTHRPPRRKGQPQAPDQVVTFKLD